MYKSVPYFIIARKDNLNKISCVIFLPIDSKQNNKKIYTVTIYTVTIKIHSTITKLKKVCLKIALKKYASLEYCEAHAEEQSITWAQPPERSYRLV